MDDAQTLPRRRISIALLLTFFGAGIGHLYAGRGRRGAVLFAIQLLHLPLLMSLAWLPAATWVLGALIAVVCFGLVFYVFALVDAARVASGAERPYRARAYNSAALYLGLIVLSSIWGMVGMAGLRAWSFEAFRIPTRSMEPAVPFDSRILVNKRPGQEFERGDIVVFEAPGQQGVKYIKRIFGLPGETVTPPGREPVTVPAGHVFVVGDNHDNSRDSRQFGPVPIDDVIGEAQYVFWQGFGTLR